MPRLTWVLPNKRVDVRKLKEDNILKGRATRKWEIKMKSSSFSYQLVITIKITTEYLFNVGSGLSFDSRFMTPSSSFSTIWSSKRN